MPDILNPDIPMTARIPSWIIILLVVGTGGYFMVGIGLYLSWWVWRRRPMSYAFYLYLLCTLIVILPFDRSLNLPDPWGLVLAVFAFAVFLSAPFILRHELQDYLETQGSHVEMAAGWLLLFGAAYINYCLSIIFSGEGGSKDRGISISPSQ